MLGDNAIDGSGGKEHNKVFGTEANGVCEDVGRNEVMECDDNNMNDDRSQSKMDGCFNVC